MKKNTIIIGDVHGNLDALIHTLMAAGAVNRDGTKNNDWRVVSVGDLCNMAPYGESYRGFVSEDLDVAEWALDGVIDDLVVGNHELYFTHGLQVGIWHGMAYDSELQPRLKSLITRKAQHEGMFVAAVEVDGMLITHAGLHKNLAKRDGISLTDPAAAADKLNEMLIESAMHKGDPNDAINNGRAGIFWNRPKPWGGWDYGHGADYVQVCGHTPLGDHPKFYAHLNAWIIDSGNYMNASFPTVGALVKRDGEDEYRVFNAETEGVPS